MLRARHNVAPWVKGVRLWPRFLVCHFSQNGSKIFAMLKKTLYLLLIFWDNYHGVMLHQLNIKNMDTSQYLYMLFLLIKMSSFWGLCLVRLIPGVPARDTAHLLLARNSVRDIPDTKQWAYMLHWLKNIQCSGVPNSIAETGYTKGAHYVKLMLKGALL